MFLLLNLEKRAISTLKLYTHARTHTPMCIHTCTHTHVQDPSTCGADGLVKGEQTVARSDQLTQRKAHFKTTYFSCHDTRSGFSSITKTLV